MKAEKAEETGKLVTTGDLIRWGTILATVCTTLVSLVWFCASFKQDVALQRADLETVKRQAVDWKAEVNKRLDTADAKQTTTDKTLVDVQRKLDVAVALLEEIKGKVQPALGQ